MRAFLLNLIGSAINKIFGFLSSKWSILFLVVINPIVAIIAFSLSLLARLETYLNQMMLLGTNSMGQVVELNSGTSLGIANYFFPLDLLFVCCSSLLSLWLVSISYRFVKSWIPTLS